MVVMLIHGVQWNHGLEPKVQVLFVYKWEFSGPITCNGKCIIGGGVRGGQWLAENGAIRCVMEELLEGNDNDAFVGIPEMQVELGQANDCIVYQISMLVEVRGHD